MPNGTTLIIRNRTDREKTIKDAIFAFSGGTKSLLIKGEGEEISTVVEVAEILKKRMYPGVEIANISLGSRPFFENNQRNNYRKNNRNNNNNNRTNKKDLISKIEITLSKSHY
jgi:DNA-binding protein Alba